MQAVLSWQQWRKRHVPPMLLAAHPRCLEKQDRHAKQDIPSTSVPHSAPAAPTGQQTTARPVRLDEILRLMGNR